MHNTAIIKYITQDRNIIWLKYDNQGGLNEKRIKKINSNEQFIHGNYNSFTFIFTQIQS